MPSLNAMHLTSLPRAVASLTQDERTAMHELMVSHYESVPRELFERDLSAKDEVLTLLDESGKLRGFTTIAWNPAGVFDEGDIMFSGDTIIDRKCWGTQELVRAFCRRAGAWKAVSGRRLYWFLISKGHRTYLYLPLFARRFFPHPETVEPGFAGLTARVAAGLFGDFWKPDEGVIRFPTSLGHLRDEMDCERDNNPWVRYFIKRNPGYASGEELACLTEMCGENLRRAALAAFIEGMGGEE